MSNRTSLMRLKNKVAIITGATSGIGRATAIRFAQEGANLIITGRRSELGKQVECMLNNISNDNCRCIYVQADHTVYEDCQKVVNAALQEFGGKIDVLFNNAGIVTNGTAETTTEEVWNATFDINVTATWRMTKLVLPYMKQQKSGVIVNNGSDWSVVAGKNALSYVMSKGAVGMMTKQMALDYARDGIRVNAVCPGDTFVDRWIEQGYFDGTSIQEASDFIPLGRFGTPDEIANCVLFLASDESSYVTGHLLVVDGGHTAN